MKLEIQVSNLAESDIEKIWLYTFEKWSLEQANNYQDILFIGFSEIANNTDLGKKIKFDNRLFHYYKKQHHYIFYNYSETQLFIYRVLHKKMDFERHL